MSEDLNSVVLQGHLASDAELRVFDSGTRMLRLLVTTRMVKPHRRVDVIPVQAWADDMTGFDQLAELVKGDELQLHGTLQRRYWEAPDGRRSRMEVTAISWFRIDRHEGDEEE